MKIKYNFYGCDVIGSRDKFRPYREIVEGSIPSDHIYPIWVYYYIVYNNIY